MPNGVSLKNRRGQPRTFSFFNAVISSGDVLPDLGPARVFYIDPDGGTWAVFRDGVVRFSMRDGQFSADEVVRSPLEGGVNYMLLDDKWLWLATNSEVARLGR